jgi:hypothetical protein
MASELKSLDDLEKQLQAEVRDLQEKLSALRMTRALLGGRKDGATPLAHPAIKSENVLVLHGAVAAAIREALPKLPNKFTRPDLDTVLDTMGHKFARNSLRIELGRMPELVGVAIPGKAGRPTVYRKISP